MFVRWRKTVKEDLQVSDHNEDDIDTAQPALASASGSKPLEQQGSSELQSEIQPLELHSEHQLSQLQGVAMPSEYKTGREHVRRSMNVSPISDDVSTHRSPGRYELA